MVGLHALKSLGEQPPTLHVINLLFSGDGPGYIASGPEHMAHRAPWVLRVCTEVCCAILADGETWRGAGKGQINETAFVHSGFKGVCIARFVQRQRDVVSGKGEHALIEHVVVKGIGKPDVRLSIA